MASFQRVTLRTLSIYGYNYNVAPAVVVVGLETIPKLGQLISTIEIHKAI